MTEQVEKISRRSRFGKIGQWCKSTDGGREGRVIRSNRFCKVVDDGDGYDPTEAWEGEGGSDPLEKLLTILGHEVATGEIPTRSVEQQMLREAVENLKGHS